MIRSSDGLHIFCLIFSVLIVNYVGSFPSRAADPAKVMVVLDASGSMWGQIGGQSKITIARQALRDLMKGWDKDLHVGLSVYGHRRKGDCKDIQTLVPVGPLDPQSLMQSVSSIRPKGKTPLSEAVRRAAEELKYTEEKATVILISDGKETCDADPCELGRQLEKLGVDFTTHVIGFDLKKGEQAGLQCLADNTGGIFINASNPAALLVALTTTVEEVRKEQKKNISNPVPPKKAEIKVSKPKAPKTKPGHRFSAFLVSDGAPVEGNIRWDIYEAKAGAAGKRKHITGNYDARPNFVLKPGKYYVVAKHGDASASQDFEVESAEQAEVLSIVLNAGQLAFDAALAEGGPAVKSGLRWDVYEDQKDIDGKRKHINGNYDANPEFILPAGKYFAVARLGNAHVSLSVDILAGKREQVSVVFDAGLAVLKARFAEGGALVQRGMRWDIYHSEKGIDGKRKHINGNYETRPTFILPAGKYFVAAKRGNATKSQNIEIKSGKRNEFDINLNAGLMYLSASLTKGHDRLKKGMRWDIYSIKKDIEGKRKHFNGNYEATPTFTLPQGKYYVVAKNGNSVRTGEVEVNAGKRTEFPFDLKAGRIKFSAKDANGTALKKGLRWDIYQAEADIEGKRQHLNGNYDAEPVFTLNSGKYLLVMKFNKKTAHQEFSIQPGETKTIEVTVDTP